MWKKQAIKELNSIDKVAEEKQIIVDRCICYSLNYLVKNEFKKEDLRDFDLNYLVNVINNNISNFNSIAVANTFNYLAQLDYNKNDLKELKIDLLVNNLNKNMLKIHPIGMSNICNGLSKIGYKIGDLKDLNVKLLIENLNQNLAKFDPMGIANTFNGLSRLGFTTKDLNGLDLKLLAETVNKAIPDFNFLGISNTFNGLAQIGYRAKYLYTIKPSRIVENLNKNMLEFNPVSISNMLNGLSHMGYNSQDLKDLKLKLLAKNINDNISDFSATVAIAAINGLVTLFFYDGINNSNKVLINTILKLMNNFKANDEIEKTTFNKNLYVLKNIFKSKYFKDIDFLKLNNNEKEKIDNQRLNNKNEYEVEKAKQISQVLNSKKVEFQPSIEEDCGFGTLMGKGCDIKIETDDCIYYIEIDGPMHFRYRNMTNVIPSTIIRNKIAVSMIKNTRNAKAIRYLTIPINAKLKTKDDIYRYAFYNRDPIRNIDLGGFMELNGIQPKTSILNEVRQRNIFEEEFEEETQQPKSFVKDYLERKDKEAEEVNDYKTRIKD